MIDAPLFLPTVHGFDEFFGNLYHLNAEEEPENEDYPKASEYPDFKKNFGPRGVLHSWANTDGTQKIEDTGPLTKKRMETMDEGIADNTIVMYSTDNGAEKCSWPDGGSTPFRGEKASNWEGGWRVPTAIRWPGVIRPGTVSNGIFSHQDMLPTLVAAAGELDIAEKCKKGYTAGRKTFKVHLDGFNLIPHLKGDVKESPRPGFLYWGDEGDLMALRWGNWKIHFAVQRHEGAAAWQDDLVKLKLPLLVNLRSDPFEEADLSGDMYYWKWRADRVFMLLPAGALVAKFMQTMVEFPPRQSPESWTPEQMMEKLKKNAQALKAAAHPG